MRAGVLLCYRAEGRRAAGCLIAVGDFSAPCPWSGTLCPHHSFSLFAGENALSWEGWEPNRPTPLLQSVPWGKGSILGRLGTQQALEERAPQ